MKTLCIAILAALSFGSVRISSDPALPIMKYYEGMTQKDSNLLLSSFTADTKKQFIRQMAVIGGFKAFYHAMPELRVGMSVMNIAYDHDASSRAAITARVFNMDHPERPGYNDTLIFNVSNTEEDTWKISDLKFVEMEQEHLLESMK